MSRSRKRQAAVSDDGEEEDEDLWGEEEAEASTAKQPKKRTRQTSLIEDVVGGDEEEDGGGGGGGGGDGDEFNDGFDEDLYGDDDDRAHLASLAEVEREAILYQRAEKRRELEERREAKRKATQGAGGSRPPIGMRGRTRGSGGRSGGSSLPDALADLIARRHKQTTSKPSESVVLAGEDEDEEEAEMAETTRRRQQSRQQRRSRAREPTGDSDEEEDEEVDVADQREAEATVEEEAEKERRKHEARFSIPGSHTPLRLSDLKLIQLRRDRLEKIHEEPFFAAVVQGMFVRVTIGHDHQRNAPKYKVGEVVGVGEMRQKYPFPPGTARSTRVSLMLQRGDARRLFAMSAISNQSITEEEFTAYVAEMRKAGQQLLTAEEALERKKKAEFVKESYVYTPELVAQMVEDKKGRGKHTNVTLERTRLEIDLARVKNAVDGMRERIKAKAQRGQGGQREVDEDDDGEGGGGEGGEEDALQAEEARLEAVENKLAELREVELKAAKTAKSRSEMVAIVEVNRRNQSRDIEEARSMFFSNQQSRREEDEQLRLQGKKREATLDPFKRRATRPSMNFEEEKEQEPQQREEHKADTPPDTSQEEVEVRGLVGEGLGLVQEVVIVGRGSVGLLAFGHPPSLSERMLAQLRLSHEGGGEVDVERTGEVSGAAGSGRRYGSRVWQSKYSALPANERVLSISDYWARREQA